MATFLTPGWVSMKDAMNPGVAVSSLNVVGAEKAIASFTLRSIVTKLTVQRRHRFFRRMYDEPYVYETRLHRDTARFLSSCS